MAYWRRWSKLVGTINFKCSKCNTQGAAGLFKKRTLVLLLYFIPIWYRKRYYVTCGHCLGNFKIDKEQGTQLELRRKKKGASLAPQMSAAPTQPANATAPPIQAAGAAYCIHCGASMTQEAAFCPACGQKQ